MRQYFDTLTNISGAALNAATLQVLNFPSNTVANIYSANSTSSPISNATVSSDVTGQVSFFAPDGLYTFKYSYQGNTYKTRSPVTIGTPFSQTSAESSATVVPLNYQYTADHIGADVRRYGNIDLTGATDTSSILSTAASVGNALYLPPGTYRVSSNLNLSVPLIFDSGAILKPDASVTITLSKVWAGSWQIFNVSNSGSVIQGAFVGYNPLPVWYGADPAGASDSAGAFTALLNAVIANNGGALVIPSGTYKLLSTISLQLTPSSGSNVEKLGLILYAHGVSFNYTGSSYAFDFISVNSLATYHGPLIAVIGANLTCTSSALGGFRQRSVSTAHWHDCFVYGATSGPAWTLLNDTGFSENNHWKSCGAVNCQSIMAFQVTGGTSSFSRTYVDGMFGAGISNYWFDIGGAGNTGNCSVYDSRFTHISGNSSSLGLFALGSSTKSCDMTSTVVDGLDYEIGGGATVTFTAGLAATSTSGTLTSNWTFPTGQYGVVFSDGETRVVTLTNGATSATWTGGLASNVTANAATVGAVVTLRDYPQNSGSARRPILVNVGAFATSWTFNSNTVTAPTWVSNVGATLAGPESAQTVAWNTALPIQSNYGQSQVYETLGGVNAIKNVATTDTGSFTFTLTSVTGSPTAAMSWFRDGRKVTLIVTTGNTGASSASSMGATGLPAAITPSVTQNLPMFVHNAGNGNCVGAIQITSGGSVSFGVAGSSPVQITFTGFSGTVGLDTGSSVTYTL